MDVAVPNSIMSEKVIEELEKFFSVHGVPEVLKTDNGPQFVSDVFAGYLKENDIVHSTTTPLWPQANGEVERQNRSVLKTIKIAQLERKPWQRELLKFLLAYRSPPHSTTGVSPAKLLFGREIRTKRPELKEECPAPQMIEVRDKDNEMKQKGKDYADGRSNAQESQFDWGDKVLMKKPKVDKLTPNFYETPLRVVEQRGSDVTVKSETGSKYRRNSSHFRKFETEVATDHECQETKEGGEKTLRRSERVRKPPERYEA